MAELQGTLSILSVSGLLQVLSTERRTGRLVLTGPDEEHCGSLWVERGEVVHAETPGGGGGDGSPSRGEDAAHALVMIENGRFAFEPDVASPERTVDASTDQLLMEAACRSDHARRDNPDIPESAVPSLAPLPEMGSTPRFNTLQWRILAAIDGRRSVAELCSDTELPRRVVDSVLGQLTAAGVLELK